jgi:protease-4
MQQPRRSSNWWIPLAVIGGLIVVIIVVIGAVIGTLFAGLGEFGSKKEVTEIKDRTVLMLDLSSGVGEFEQPNPFKFGGNESGTDLINILGALRDAKDDDNIKGVLIKGDGAVGMTKLTEIREAVVDFKKSGKFVYAFFESATRQQYYLASAADSIFMPQEGIAEFNAMGATGMFFKQLSDKIGVTWHVEQFEEFKSAAEMPSRENWSEPAKREVREIIEHRQRTFVSAVASGRNIPAETVTSLMDEGVYVADSLLAHRLIDGFRRFDDLRESIARRVDPSDTSAHPKLRTTSIDHYVNREQSGKSAVDEDHAIAIVYATGAIASGSGDGSGDGIYARTLIKNLRKAADNDEVQAILLRIDSPGGSAIASDEIWNTIREIRKTKPVYASMSDVAASGGYYIAMACDTIIAHPTTITGSIGVIMAMPNVSGTLGKIGITIDTISLGRSSHFMNGAMPYSESDKSKLHEFGSGIYRRFVQKVADARHKDFESTRALAKGRVWTGDAALANGLIDATGGFQEAIRMIKKRIGADPNKKVTVYTYPEKLEPIEVILRLFNLDDDEEDARMTNQHGLSTLLASAVQPGMPVEEFWRALPEGTRRQFRHAAAMADIGATEPTMTMMPMVIAED